MQNEGEGVESEVREGREGADCSFRVTVRTPLRKAANGRFRTEKAVI